MLTEEGHLKKQVKAYLKSIGAQYYMPVPGGFGKQSVDFLCCINGRYVAIETKKPGKGATKRQDIFLTEVQEAGGIGFCCDTYDSFLVNMGLNGLIPASSA